MLRRVISGGQTGVDQAALRAAKRIGLETGGTAPKGFLTEDGENPKLAKLYGLKEHSSDKYPPRTAKNIKDADLTLIISKDYDGGSKLTAKLAMGMQKPVFLITASDMDDDTSFDEVVTWIRRRRHEIINVAGNRESKTPGIGCEAEAFLVDLFRRLC
jgi:Circularly permutated YpsA SLOG family